jgi:hypothetical protein
MATGIRIEIQLLVNNKIHVIEPHWWEVQRLIQSHPFKAEIADGGYYDLLLHCSREDLRKIHQGQLQTNLTKIYLKDNWRTRTLEKIQTIDRLISLNSFTNAIVRVFEWESGIDG